MTPIHWPTVLSSILWAAGVSFGFLYTLYLLVTA